MMDNEIEEIITILHFKLGRIPTEDEVYYFIFGNDLDRMMLWNTGYLPFIRYLKIQGE